MDVDGGDAEPKGTDVSDTGVPTDNHNNDVEEEEQKQDEVVEDDDNEANADGTGEGRSRLQINDSANAFQINNKKEKLPETMKADPEYQNRSSTPRINKELDNTSKGTGENE